MNTIIRLSSILFLFTICGSAASFASENSESPPRETRILTIQEAVQEAIENNWALKAKEETIVRATELHKRSYKDFFPKFSTSYNYTRLRDKTRQVGSFQVAQSRDNFYWTTEMRQPLFTGYRLLSTYELTKLQIDAISVSSSLITLAGDTSNRRSTLQLREAIKQTNLGGVTERLELAPTGRDSFKMTISAAR